MTEEPQEPQVFRLLQGEAVDIHRSPTGDVGRVFRGEGLEAVWVAKQQEVIDAAWFSQPSVDLLLILQGQLQVEFEQTHQAPMVLFPGDLLVLPAHTRCRAYRWPRDRQEATIFLAVYPVRGGAQPLRARGNFPVKPLEEERNAERRTMKRRSQVG